MITRIFFTLIHPPDFFSVKRDFTIYDCLICLVNFKLKMSARNAHIWLTETGSEKKNKTSTLKLWKPSFPMASGCDLAIPFHVSLLLRSVHRWDETLIIKGIDFFLWQRVWYFTFYDFFDISHFTSPTFYETPQHHDIFSQWLPIVEQNSLSLLNFSDMTAADAFSVTWT